MKWVDRFKEDITLMQSCLSSSQKSIRDKLVVEINLKDFHKRKIQTHSL